MEVYHCNGIEIRVDNDKIYEKYGSVRKVLHYLLWVPFVNLVPKRLGVWFFTRSSDHTRLIRRYATTYKALELMYQYENENLNNPRNNVIENFFTRFWESNTLNALAVRNRLKLVKKKLRESFETKKNYPKVKILSLASGSARAVIEVMAEFRKKGVQIEARFVDLSRSALNYSKELAKEYEVAHLIKWIRTDVREVNRYCGKWRPDIVEMVGLLDYFDQPEAIKLISKIYNCLAEKGILLTCNVKENPEKRFVTEIVGWEMIYRDEYQLAEILVEGGFEPRQCQVIYEPYKIHGLAIAKKS